jgi:hypothetical protein
MKIFYATPLFNGLQVGRFDPFRLETIRFDRATMTISLQCKLILTPVVHPAGYETRPPQATGVMRDNMGNLYVTTTGGRL